MTREKRIKAPPGYPFFGWSRDTIKQHFEQTPPKAGDHVIIYNSQAGLHRYALATVDVPSSGPQKRIILSRAGDSGGTSFYRNGINTYMPKGQTFLLPPVPVLTEHLTSDCEVVLDVPLYS